jgi:hypothetical protein
VWSSVVYRVVVLLVLVAWVESGTESYGSNLLVAPAAGTRTTCAQPDDS